MPLLPEVESGVSLYMMSSMPRLKVFYRAGKELFPIEVESLCKELSSLCKGPVCLTKDGWLACP
jgi:hypothetical protein